MAINILDGKPHFKKEFATIETYEAKIQPEDTVTVFGTPKKSDNQNIVIDHAEDSQFLITDTGKDESVGRFAKQAIALIVIGILFVAFGFVLFFS